MAFVDVETIAARSVKAELTGALETALNVCTDGLFVTVVILERALVAVFARFAVAIISGDAGTGVTTGNIQTHRIFATFMNAFGAFV